MRSYLIKLISTVVLTFVVFPIGVICVAAVLILGVVMAIIGRLPDCKDKLL